jgi:uncharacterized membrane protein (UPF0127 family)
MKIRLPSSFLILLLATSCSSRNSGSSLPVEQITIGSQTFNIEIAKSYHDQEVGLMHRDHLDSDHGMIFVNDHPFVQNFWNHDTHFDLDLVFLGPDGTVVSLKHLTAWSEKTVSSEVPAQYVIELNAGTGARLNLHVGDHITLPPQK